jgi:anti-anti-sigma factor
MQIECTHAGGVTTLRPLEKRLDVCQASSLRSALLSQLMAGQHIELDLQDVEFMDCAALGALVAALKQLRPLGSLSVIAPAKSVRALFQLTHLDQVISVRNAVTAPAASFGT